MTTTNTTAPAQTNRVFPPRAKPDRISGCWLNEVRQYPGRISMSFTDPETRARFILEAHKPADPKVTPSDWVVYQGKAGETSRGEPITEVLALPMTTRAPNAVKDGVFMAFVDTTCKRRYVIFENTLPPRPGVVNPPQFNACIDRSFDPRPYVRPAADDAGPAYGENPETGAVAPADPAALQKTPEGDIPF